jgi:hypothetical protein
MNILLALIFLGLSLWALVALLRRLREQRVSARWWAALACLVLCGIGLGVWCAFYCEYQVGARLRFGSFPVPVVVFHLEQGSWVDFPLQKFAAWPVAFTNIITITALATLPLWLVSRKGNA